MARTFVKLLYLRGPWGGQVREVTEAQATRDIATGDAQKIEPESAPVRPATRT